MSTTQTATSSQAPQRQGVSVVDEQAAVDLSNRTDKYWLFQPGQSGNPGGRPKGGESVIEALKRLQHLPPAELRKIAKSKDSPVSRVIAAKRILDAARDAVLPDGRMISEPRLTMAEVLDRTDGKAVQSVRVASVTYDARSLEDAETRLAAAAQAILAAQGTVDNLGPPTLSDEQHSDAGG